MESNRFLFVLAAIAALAVAGCGGGGGTSGGTSVVPTGGGGSSVTPTPTATTSPTPTATPTIAPQSISGTAVEFTSGTPLAGFTVTIGQTPAPSTCLNSESNTVMACGFVASPAATATTSSTGAFTLSAVPGTYMLTIGKDSTFATLHRTITVAATGLALGSVKIAALTADEQAWVTDLNSQRATVSVPVSFANLQVDEYAQELARAEAVAVANGTQPFGDATEALYQTLYAAEPGVMYQASGSAGESSVTNDYVNKDNQFFAEKSNCTAGNWQTCVFSGSTGHYINLSNTQNVWVGVGQSSTPLVISPTNHAYVYDVIPVVNYQASYPASNRRAAPTN
jgi:hypothetical protein